MDIKKDVVILPEDPAAAEYRNNISGWVSRNRHYFGEEEDLARYDGATHRKCKTCAVIIPKNSYCRACSFAREEIKFNAMPVKPYDGESMLYSVLHNEYFSSLDDATEYADNEDIPVGNLMLVICEKEYGRTIDPEDFFDLPDDVDSLRDVAPVLAGLIDAVNAHIESGAECLAWVPGDFAVEMALYIKEG
jgi:hypothetical protein